MSRIRHMSRQCLSRVTVYIPDIDWPWAASVRLTGRALVGVTLCGLLVLSSVVAGLPTATTSGGDASEPAQSSFAAYAGQPVPPPELGENRTYNGTFRIAAGNDADPGHNESTVPTLVYTNGTVKAVNRTVGPRPVVLGSADGAYVMTPRDALAMANQTDAYYLSFSRPMEIPYQDQWVSLNTLRERGWLQAIRIVPRQTGFVDAPASGQAQNEQTGPQNFSVTARIATYRDQLPVHNARITSVNGSYRVANPEEAQVNLGAYRSLRHRKINATQALLRYSALARNRTTARKTALVPTMNDTAVFPTRAGGPIPRVWRNGSRPAVRDAYVGVVGVAPGAWYRDGYVTPSDRSVFTYVPWDYRMEPPADYQESATCTPGADKRSNTGSGPEGDPQREAGIQRDGSTWRDILNKSIRVVGNWSIELNRTHPLEVTRFANYTVTEWNASIERVSFGEANMSRFMPGVWTTERPSGKSPQVGPGRVPLRAHLNLSVTVKRHYGQRDGPPGCNWEETDYVSRTMNITTTEPVDTVASNASTLQVDAQVYDKPTADVVVVRFQGNQSLPVNPWERVTVSVGNETAIVQAPWRFYPVMRNDAVEQRTGEGNITRATSFSWTTTFPHLYRTRVAVAPISTRLKRPSHAWWEPRSNASVAARSIPGTDLPATIVAPGNANGTTFYARYVGRLYGNSISQGKPVTVEAETVFGLPVATNVTVKRYQPATLAIWTASRPTANHTRVYVQLTDASGDPILGREITIQGATPGTVTTNASGIASARVTGAMVIARFDGDPWQASHSTYYQKATNVTASAAPLIGAANSVLGYLDAITSKIAQIAAWLVLGVFLIWWRWFWGEPASR